jgi:hypothetical protein
MWFYAAQNVHMAEDNMAVALAGIAMAAFGLIDFVAGSDLARDQITSGTRVRCNRPRAPDHHEPLARLTMAADNSIEQRLSGREPRRWGTNR